MKSDIEIAQKASPVPITEIAAGLGLGVADLPVCGKMMTMPGLPKQPAAENIDLVNRRTVGLF